MNKTTIVIPNYNGIKYLKDCLDSLEKCGEQDFEVIVVDNGSNDGSIELIENDFRTVKLIKLSENTGFAYAVNRGIEAADTEFVLLLNNDIVVKEGFVANLENAIESDSKIFSVNARMLSMQDENVLDGTGDYYCALGWAFAAGKGKKADKYRTKRCNIFSACGGAAIYRKSVLDEIGLFDEAHFAYLEDVDLGYRARIRGYKNIYEPSAVCLHAGSGSSGSRYNEFKIKLSARNSIYLVYKNMPLLQLIINLPFIIVGIIIKFLFFVLKGYGIIYIKAIGDGFAICKKEKKVVFELKNIGSYVLIEIELLANIIRRFI